MSWLILGLALLSAYFLVRYLFAGFGLANDNDLLAATILWGIVVTLVAITGG